MSTRWQKLRWFTAYWISRFAIQFGRLLPTRLCYAVANPIADVCFFVCTRHRRNLIENLRRVVGDEAARPAARRVFRNFGKYVIDFYQLPTLGHEALSKRVVFDDWQNLDAILDSPGGTIFVTLHLGQAELGGAALSTYDHPINVVAEPLEYPPMNEFIQSLRRALGMKIIDARRAKTGVLRCLNRGEVLAMMFDAVEPGDGIRVDLFGAPAEVSSAPARVAIRSGARILPAIVSRDPADPTRIIPSIDFDLRFEPTGDEERDVRELTQALAHAFERFIRQYADQWFAFRSVWHEEAPPDAGPASTTWRVKALEAAVRLGEVLPRSFSYGLARLAGDLAYRYRYRARADVQDNMRHVLGVDASEEVVSRHAREAFRNVARYYVDLIRLRKTTSADLRNKYVRLHGFERLTEPLAAGRGVIVATAHFGNPEMAVQVGAVLGLNVLVLAEPLRPPAFARLMTQIRSAFGPRYVDVGYSAIANAIHHLRAGGCLAITCDRDIQGKGTPLPFFGIETPLPTGAVELAKRTGALLVPGYCHRAGDAFDVYFEEPIELVDTGRPKEDTRTNSLALLARTERWISSDPGQWLPLERIWKPVAAETEAAAEEPIAVDVRP